MGKKREQQEARKAKAISARSRRRFMFGVGASALVGLVGYGLFAALNGPPLPSATVGFDPAARMYETDIVHGDAKAPVTVVEYASLTCIHCARFHNEALPAFLKGWVDTGKVRLIYRHFPFDGDALAAAGVVSCLPEASRPAAVAALMRHRDRWIGTGKPAEQGLDLLTIERRDLTKAKQCIAEGRMGSKVVEAVNEARQAGVSSTPSFIVAGKLYAGFMSAEALGAIVDEAVAR